MATSMFYHLTRSPIEAVLPMLLNRALGQGWRVVVRGTSAARIEWLDTKLWLEPEDGFLPHGLAGGPHDEDQPVLLTTGTERPNRAACLITVDGAPVGPQDCAGLERLCILFDGNDPASLDTARLQWKSLTDAGEKAQYWSEESGRWQMKTER